MVTLHHFTNPRWVTLRGGWADEEVVGWFTTYAERVVEAVGDLVDDWCTINEPNIVATFGYLSGLFPPGHMDFSEREAANANFIAAHQAARAVIKDSRADTRVGLTVALHEWSAIDGGEDLRDALRLPMEDVFLEAVRGDDFVGVQAYTRHVIGPDGYQPVDPNARLTIMGYEYRPQALEAAIRRAWEVTHHVPIIVTENGIATADDEERIEFVATALDGLDRCLADGIDVRGYIHWSLLDNFEWAFGYGPTFGLIAVDRHTQVRTPKPSARWFGSIARANAR
jgi:beta-glucosidase